MATFKIVVTASSIGAVTADDLLREVEAAATYVTSAAKVTMHTEGEDGR